MCVFPGNLHEVLVELEGMGGGGKLQLEVDFFGAIVTKNYYGEYFIISKRILQCHSKLDSLITRIRKL